MDRSEYLAAIKAEIQAGTYVIEGGDEGLAEAILWTLRPPGWSEEQYQRWTEKHRAWSREFKRRERAAERERKERAAMAEQFDIQIRGTTADPARTKDMAKQFALRLKNIADVKSAEVHVGGQKTDVNVDPEPRERD